MTKDDNIDIDELIKATPKKDRAKLMYRICKYLQNESK